MSSIHRFFLPDAAQRTPLVLTGREAHHALDVMRLRRGDTLTVLDGAGNLFTCDIATTSRERVTLTVKEKTFTAPLPCAVTLLAAIPKGKIEDIIEKATELGVARIVPLFTERTVVKIKPEEAAGKVEKWRRIASEAIKQCGSPWLPKIDPPIKLADYLARGEVFELSLLGALQADHRHPRDCFAASRAALGRAPQTAAVWVGPEGDFTPEEVAAIRAAGAAPITLGPLVLRADTAAVYALALVSCEFNASL
jgi:16S rRNA (uracil1498-N3)-methyltransferase